MSFQTIRSDKYACTACTSSTNPIVRSPSARLAKISCRNTSKRGLRAGALGIHVYQKYSITSQKTNPDLLPPSSQYQATEGLKDPAYTRYNDLSLSPSVALREASSLPLLSDTTSQTPEAVEPTKNRGDFASFPGWLKKRTQMMTKKIYISLKKRFYEKRIWWKSLQHTLISGVNAAFFTKVPGQHLKSYCLTWPSAPADRTGRSGPETCFQSPCRTTSFVANG